MRQHGATLAQYAGRSAALKSDLLWMRSLPLFLDRREFRMVHAAWIRESVHRVSEQSAPLEDDRFLHAAVRPSTEEFRVIEYLLKGVEAPLPPGMRYRDKDGNRRNRTRIRWWLRRDDSVSEELTWHQLAMPPVDGLPDVPVSGDIISRIPGYDGEVPVFFGHYWLTGTPRVFTDLVACLDYSIAAGGVLAAYRFDGEPRVQNDRYVFVRPHK
jgi:hypothetical protein